MFTAATLPLPGDKGMKKKKNINAELDLNQILGEEPAFLYKYLDCAGAKKTIENGLKFSLPDETNDPFEFRLGGYSESEDWLRDELKKELLQNPAPLLNSDRNITDYVKNLSYDQVLSWLEIEKTAIKLQNKMSKFLGFCSFSSKKDNLLMWAHYAQKFSGVVFCFTKHVFDRELKLHKVKYKRERVLFPYNLNIPEDQLREKNLELLSTKSIDWAYEQEWRVISELSKLKQIDSFYLSPINERGFQEVIFGPKITKKDYNELKKLIRTKFHRVRFYRAVYDKTEYKLNFVRIRD